MKVSVDSHVYFSVDIGGNPVPLITDAVITMWVVTAIIILFAILSTRNLKKIPVGMQKIAEVFIDFISNMAKSQIGHHYKKFVPFICSLLLFLSLSNMIAIFNIFPTGDTIGKILHIPQLVGFDYSLHPPTKNLNVTLCLALITIIVVLCAEFRYKGFRGWLRGFYKPNPIFGFVKILDYVVRPLSLCLRLFGSILGGYIALSLLYVSIPLVIPAFVSMYFDLFDGILQAYVFIFLTTMYIAEAVEVEEEEEVK